MLKINFSEIYIINLFINKIIPLLKFKLTMNGSSPKNLKLN